MSKWMQASLGELVQYDRNITYGIVQPGPDMSPEGIPLIRGKDYSSGEVSLEGLYHVSTEIDEPYKRSKVKGNDILLSIAGYVGLIAIVPNELEGANITQTTARLSIDSSKADYKFIYYALISDDFTKEIKKYEKGSAQSGLNLGDVHNFKLLITDDIEQQRKIAKVLTTIDQLIEKSQLLLDKNTYVKEGIVADLLSRGIDHESAQLREPVDKAPHLYKKTNLGWIPKDWEITTINDLTVRVGSGITPTGGSEVYTSEGVMFLRSQNILFDGLKLDDVAYIDKKTHESMLSSELHVHDVLINITGASIGRCCYLPDGLGTVNSNQHVCSIRLSNPTEDNAYYLSKVLGSNIGQNQIFRLNAGGNREGINYQQLRSFLIPWPTSQNEIKLITERLKYVDENLLAYRTKKFKYISLKRGLMQDLLTGKVAV